jgi:hypothetical protein
MEPTAGQWEAHPFDSLFLMCRMAIQKFLSKSLFPRLSMAQHPTFGHDEATLSTRPDIPLMNVFDLNFTGKALPFQERRSLTFEPDFIN